MRKLLFPLVLAALAAPAMLVAQSPFDGIWKIDLSKVNFPREPDTYTLQDGMYECLTCTPPYKIATDGSDQSVTGHPYMDTIAIKVVSETVIEETDKKDGKVVRTSTSTVSADGRTMKFEFSDSSDTNGGPPVTGSEEMKRVARGPDGAHAVSGSWRTTKIESLSDNDTSVTYKVTGREITMTSPTGQSYTASLNGTDAPMKGDPGITTVSVKIRNKTTLEETDKRDGKVIGILRFTVGPDGKTAKGSYEDTLQNRTTEFESAMQ